MTSKRESDNTHSKTTKLHMSSCRRCRIFQSSAH